MGHLGSRGHFLRDARDLSATRSGGATTRSSGTTRPARAGSTSKRREVLLDPTAEVEKHDPINARGYRMQRWSEGDGDLHQFLADSGWRKHQSRT